MNKQKSKLKKTDKILSTKSALIYSIGIFGVSLFIGYVNSFQIEFYNKMYSALDSNIFIGSAIVILVAKLISCLADPIIGALIDKSHFKGGKIRPWILYSSVPIAVCTAVLFLYIPFKSMVAMYAFLTLTTVLWNISMSFADIPSQGMLALLSPDAEERNGAAAIANVLKSAGLAGTGVVVTVVMMILKAVFHDEIPDIMGYGENLYYIVTALAMLVFGTAMYLLIYFCNRETVKSESVGTVSFKEMFAELKRNKMMRILFLNFILNFGRTMSLAVCVQAGGALVGKVKIPILSDLIAGGAELDPTADATWLIGIAGGVVGVITIIFIPMINKKFGEKKTIIGFSVYGFVISLATYLIYALSPEGAAIRNGVPALIFTWITQALITIFYAPNNLLPPIMTADIVDYSEWKTGVRREGIDFAILSMSVKLSNALSVSLGVFVIGLSGYINGCAVTPYMQNMIMVAYVLLPGVTALISAIPVFFYKIDGDVKIQMRKDLSEKRKK